MNEQIKELKDKESEHILIARRYRDAISALQAICDHDNKYDGHGHNDSYYTCIKCGFESRY